MKKNVKRLIKMCNYYGENVSSELIIKSVDNIYIQFTKDRYYILQSFITI